MLNKEALLDRYKTNILPGPLNGTIVVGLCYYVAGPMALQNLVTQGALVIKIERKPIGDPSRYVFSKNMFNSLSHNQLSIALDYENFSDHNLLVKLFQIADVIVGNRSIKAKKNDAILQKHLQDPNKPQAQIYCSINGFPNPEINSAPALDASVQAATGLAYTNCALPDKPLKVGVPILDQVVGLLAANYIISNLHLLLKFYHLPVETKKLIYISVSMAGASIWLQTGQVINVLEGEESFRSGNQDRFAVPFSFYTTKNGLISVATVNEKQFKCFCINVLQDQVFHEQYSTFEIRLKNQTQFENDLNEKLKNNTKEYWYERCQEFNIPSSPVFTVTEAIQQNFFNELMHLSTNSRPVITHGVENSFFKVKKNFVPAPQLDQDHTILADLLCDNKEKIRARL